MEGCSELVRGVGGADWYLSAMLWGGRTVCSPCGRRFVGTDLSIGKVSQWWTDTKHSLVQQPIVGVGLHKIWELQRTTLPGWYLGTYADSDTIRHHLRGRDLTDGLQDHCHASRRPGRLTGTRRRQLTEKIQYQELTQCDYCFCPLVPPAQSPPLPQSSSRYLLCGSNGTKNREAARTGGGHTEIGGLDWTIPPHSDVLF